MRALRDGGHGRTAEEAGARGGGGSGLCLAAWAVEMAETGKAGLAVFYYGFSL